MKDELVHHIKLLMHELRLQNHIFILGILIFLKHVPPPINEAEEAELVAEFEELIQTIRHTTET